MRYFSNTVAATSPSLHETSEISAGRHSSLALDIDGNVWAWGLNTSGQLGIGTKVNSLYPTNLSTVKDIG